MIGPRSLFLIAVATHLVYAVSPGWAQTNPPAQTAKAKDADNYRLSVQVRRVILDVVVTDNAGNPAVGLKQDDFKVLEDGTGQPPRSFDVHTAACSAATQPPLDLHLPPNTFSNLSLARPDKPVTILLYDALNTPSDYLHYAHDQLVRFIKDQGNSTQVAIFILTDRLHMLQGFTDNESRLMAAVESRHLSSQTSQLRVSDDGSDAAALLGGSLPDSAETQTLRLLQDAEREEQNFHNLDRIQTTVQAFINLARFASSLPGRKNMVWMAGAFPVEIWPGRSRLAAPLENELREAQELLKDSRVAIYPIDVRGVLPAPDTHANAIMNAIADTSGGQAFYGTNDLKQAMNTAVRQGSEYYSLTYAPTNAKEDGGERRIKVVLDKPGYHLVYRERYLAPDTKHPVPPRPLVQDMNMQHGAPDASELFFEARVVPVGGPMPASPAETASMKPFIAINARINHTKVDPVPQTVQHYGINLAVVGRTLGMPLVDDGRYATNMSFGLAAYTQDGELLNGTEISVKNAIVQAQFEKIQSGGYHAAMEFAVPTDATSLRIGVRDEIGHRMGTMEVPLPVAAVVSPAVTK